MTFADFLQSLTPLRVVLFWVVPLALSQIWMAQRGTPVVRRILWAVAIVLTSIAGFAAFYIFELLPARRQERS
ncbi:MAG: hypothetical protein GYB64_07690 [Chloroflexi bacterium]|nr:hypothetical protein [Chloroflexota bacterium]